MSETVVLQLVSPIIVTAIVLGIVAVSAIHRARPEDVVAVVREWVSAFRRFVEHLPWVCASLTRSSGSSMDRPYGSSVDHVHTERQPRESGRLDEEDGQ